MEKGPARVRQSHNYPAHALPSIDRPRVELYDELPRVNIAPRKRNQTEEPSQRNNRKQQVPKRNERNELKPKYDRNIVKDNINSVVYDNTKAVQIKQRNEENDKRIKEIQTHKNYGRVPGYINKFHKQKEEMVIMKMIEEEKAKMPPGTRLMPEQERLETLADLKESRTEINNALEKLPVVSKTLQMEKHRKELEDKLIRIERAIETFSKKTVYVAY